MKKIWRYFEEVKMFFLENPLTSLLFFSTTLFFLIQHYFDFSWDFAAYILNAEYLFHGGNYFEVYRAPVISLLLGIFLFFGRIFAQYFFVFVVCFLFLYSNYRLSSALYEKYFYKFGLKKEMIIFLFYFFSLNIFVLSFGLVVGTELLSLAFFELFLAYFILNKNSGHFLALAFLSRYNFMIFLPLLLFNKDYKKILKNLGLFFLVSFPWLFYNRIKFGNYFSSIADSLYLNVFSRMDRFESFDFLSLLQVINWFLPFFIIGVSGFLGYLFYKKRIRFEDYKYELLFGFIFAVFLYDVISIPFKITRYMFNLTLPIAFFSTLGSIFILKSLRERGRKIFTIFLIISFFVGVIFVGQYYFRISVEDSMYYEASQEIKELGLENCEILSPHWVPTNYFSGNVRFLPYDLETGISSGNILLLYKGFGTMDDKFNQEEILNYYFLSEGEHHIILAKESVDAETCIRSRGNSKPMIGNSCQIMSYEFGEGSVANLFEKFCNFINFN